MIISVKTQVVFEEQVDINGELKPFRDALYLDPQAYAVMNPDDLAAMMKQRADNYAAVVMTPQPEPPEPTDEDLQAQVDAIQAQIDALSDQQSQVQEQLSQRVSLRLGKNQETIQ
jgi:hypothetical protein